jgi:uncharacterized protein YkwD
LRKHLRRSIAVCGLALALAPLGAPGAAVAAGPSITLSPDSGTPGSSFTINGSGFHSSETISLYWNGTAVASLGSSSTGTFIVRATLGSAMPAGTRSVAARGSVGDWAGATFTVLSVASSVAQPTQSPSTATSAPGQPTQTAQPTKPTPIASATSTAAPAPGSGIPTSGVTSNGCQITPDQAAAEQYLLATLNQHRAAAGAPALQINQTLSLASRQHSCDMFQHQQLTHTGSDGSSPFDRMRAVGVTFSTAGENIGMAGGYGLTGGINTVDSGMMAEPLTYGNHHWNIVNAAYKQVGLGVIYANGQLWLTEDFTG